MQAFLDRIEAGVIYVNRREGATTGAWPGIQTFCGWKASGASGKGGLGPHYLPQFMREQSRTVMPDLSSRHAARCSPSPASNSGGSSLSHGSKRCGQRGCSRQPGGMWAASGTSPLDQPHLAGRAGSGTAATSACV